MKNTFEFAADRITVNGKSFPARYEMATDGVNIFATVTEDNQPKTVCIRVNVADPLYPAALAAVQIIEEPQTAPEAQQTEEPQQAEPEAQQTKEPQTEPEAEQTEPEAPQAVEEAQAEPEAPQTVEEAQAEPEAPQAEPEAPQAEPEAPQAAEAPAHDPKAARGVVPEKTFIGQSITGAGWAIIFDGSCNRTRVIISKGNHDKLRGIVESAGFYYSPTLDSWNRKLTFRAYRAAQALAQELTAALAA